MECIMWSEYQQELVSTSCLLNCQRLQMDVTFLCCVESALAFTKGIFIGVPRKLIEAKYDLVIMDFNFRCICCFPHTAPLSVEQLQSTTWLDRFNLLQNIELCLKSWSSTKKKVWKSYEMLKERNGNGIVIRLAYTFLKDQSREAEGFWSKDGGEWRIFLSVKLQRIYGFHCLKYIISLKD